MGGSEYWASPEMAVALRGIGVAASDFSAITPLSTFEQSALQISFSTAAPRLWRLYTWLIAAQSTFAPLTHNKLFFIKRNLLRYFHNKFFFIKCNLFAALYLL
jgi:hypothetical protein